MQESTSEKKIRPITEAELIAARSWKVWELGNRVLYDLCRDHPDHARDNEILAKIWLIGRSYSASIERRRILKQIGNEFYERLVAPAMRQSDLDLWLTTVLKDPTPGGPKTISVHKNLMDLFKSITDLEKRS